MTRTNHPLYFDRLSPRDFERLTLWLARREGYTDVEHRGASGADRGRDLLARKDGRRVVFQCKREKAFGPRDAEEAVDAILRLPAEDIPDELVIVTACDVSDAARQSTEARGADRLSCAFWALTELDEKVKRHPEVVEEFFGALPGSPGVPFVLPQADTASFTGREAEVARLRELLIERTGPRLCSIVGLAGTGGIGKSALAAHFAALHQDDFPNGVIGLRVDGKDPGTLAREFARSCGVEIDPEDERPASALMQEIFRHRRALLIFDNADDASVRELLPGGDRCAVIVTTRDRSLPPLLDVPETAAIELPVLPTDECEALLQFLLGAGRVAAEPAAVSEIAALVGRLPLALQIVGHTLREQPWRSLADYSRSLAEERSRLERLRVRGASHLDVRASFSLSLQILSDEEIDFLACLSVCAPGGFSVRGAAAAGGLDEASTSTHLGTLYRYSLLNLGVGSRFIFHPLIYRFATELAEQRRLSEAAKSRHISFFVELIKALDVRDPVAQGADDIEDILLTAQRLLRQGLFEQAALAFHKSYELEIELDNPKGQAMALFSLGGVWQRMGRFEQAADAFQRSLHLLPEAEESRVQAMILHSLGGVYQRQGRFEQTVEAFQKSYELEVELDNARRQAMVLNSLGGVYQRQGLFDKAVDAFQSSYLLLAESGDHRGQAMILNSLGGVYQRQGRFEQAVDVFQGSYQLLTELGDRRSQAMVLSSLGGVYQRQGQFEQTVDVFQRSLQLLTELGDQRGQAMILNSLGGIYQRQGRFEQAIDSFQRSYQLLTELGDRRGQAMVLESLGGVYQRQGLSEKSQNAFRASIEIGEELEDRWQGARGTEAARRGGPRAADQA